MTQIKRIPVELLRQLPRENQAEYIAKYHALCTQKYDWLVRPFSDYNEQSFYAKGERPITSVWSEIFDCNWTPEQWHTRPYRYLYNPIQDAWYESYARLGLAPLSEYDYGHKREDSLILKNGQPHYYGMFRDNGGNVSAHWFVDRDDIWIMHNGSHTHYYGASGEHTQGGTFSSVVGVKNPLIEPVMKAAKAMNTAKYKGVYKPFIERLVTLYKLNETQI